MGSINWPSKEMHRRLPYMSQFVDLHGKRVRAQALVTIYEDREHEVIIEQSSHRNVDTKIS